MALAIAGLLLPSREASSRPGICREFPLMMQELAPLQSRVEVFSLQIFSQELRRHRLCIVHGTHNWPGTAFKTTARFAALQRLSPAIIWILAVVHGTHKNGLQYSLSKNGVR